VRGTETVVVVRGTRRDDLDDSEASAPAEHEIPNCIIWPRVSEEEGKGQVVLEGENVFTPPDADVLASDKIRVRGVLYDVEGKPGDYRMKGRKKGLLVVCKRLGS
jgi:hypothetical protein